MTDDAHTSTNGNASGNSETNGNKGKIIKLLLEKIEIFKDEKSQKIRTFLEEFYEIVSTGK